MKAQSWTSRPLWTSDGFQMPRKFAQCKTKNARILLFFVLLITTSVFVSSSIDAPLSDRAHVYGQNWLQRGQVLTYYLPLLACIRRMTKSEKNIKIRQYLILIFLLSVGLQRLQFSSSGQARRHFVTTDVCRMRKEGNAWKDSCQEDENYLRS